MSEEMDDSELDAGAIFEVRQIAKDITGGNCMFVDDDVRVLGRLAINAIKAGLFDGVPDGIKANCLKAMSEWPEHV